MMTFCNQVFQYRKEIGFLYGVIVSGILVGVYLTFRICKLCSSAFSYSNFHIHETYKFYALAIIALSFTIFYHKTQLEYLNEYPNDIEEGYEILIDLFGIISIYFTRLLYSFNGLIWLLITLGCDFTESQLTISQIVNNFANENRKKSLRRRMQILKRIIGYIIYPGLVILTIVGELQREHWCSVVKSTLIAGSTITIGIFGMGSGLFLWRRWKDKQTSSKTKGALIYLLVAITLREAYLIVTQVTDYAIFSSEWVLLAFSILCILLPLLVMSVLSELQLQKEKCALLKSSDVMLFKSTLD